MSKISLVAWFCVISMVLQAQEGMMSKEQFHHRIKQSFNDSINIAFRDIIDKLYIDTAFHLPVPLYKAVVTENSPENNILFFYLYPYKEYDSVFNIILNTQYKEENNSLRYKTDLPISDSTQHFFVIYFFPAHYESKKSLNLKRSVSRAFEDIMEDVELIEVVQEKKVESPPPPPPPKPSSRKTGKQ